MIVIADTGSLNHLVLIGEVEVLKPLYRRVIVPEQAAEKP
jgi:predicted nucleic acid-binding protein